MSSKYIDIVFDGPPAPESGRFVEVEDEQQRSISIGDWVEDGDFWRLRISEPYKRIAELEHELEESRKAFRYELNEVKCADETIVDLETARNRLCEAIIEEYKTKGAFEKVYDMATEILGDD